MGFLFIHFDILSILLILSEIVFDRMYRINCGET